MPLVVHFRCFSMLLSVVCVCLSVWVIFVKYTIWLQALLMLSACACVCVYALRFVCVIWSCSFCFYSVNLCAISADCLCDSL